MLVIRGYVVLAERSAAQERAGEQATAPGRHEQAIGTPASVGRDPPQIVVARVHHAPAVRCPDRAIADAVGREARPHALTDIEHPYVAAGRDRVLDADHDPPAVGGKAR